MRPSQLCIQLSSSAHFEVIGLCRANNKFVITHTPHKWGALATSWCTHAPSAGTSLTLERRRSPRAAAAGQVQPSVLRTHPRPWTRNTAVQHTCVHTGTPQPSACRRGAAAWGWEGGSKRREAGAFRVKAHHLVRGVVCTILKQYSSLLSVGLPTPCSSAAAHIRRMHNRQQTVVLWRAVLGSAASAGSSVLADDARSPTPARRKDVCPAVGKGLPYILVAPLYAAIERNMI